MINLIRLVKNMYKDLEPSKYLNKITPTEQKLPLLDLSNKQATVTPNQFDWQQINVTATTKKDYLSSA